MLPRVFLLMKKYIYILQGTKLMFNTQKTTIIKIGILISRKEIIILVLKSENSIRLFENCFKFFYNNNRGSPSLIARMAHQSPRVKTLCHHDQRSLLMYLEFQYL